MKDYEALKRELPGDNEVVESLRKAQLALQNSRGEDYAGKLEVEAVSALDDFKSIIASAGNFNTFILISAGFIHQVSSCFIYCLNETK